MKLIVISVIPYEKGGKNRKNITAANGIKKTMI